MKLLLLFLFLSGLLAADLTAQVPQIINYQGRVAVGTTNFDGSGFFKFALVNAAGNTTYWSNDATSINGSQPTTAVTLTVAKGLYSVLLGDTTLTNMSSIPVNVFNNTDVRLRVWFNDGTNGSQLLAPDQRLTTTGYAMTAAGMNLPATASSTTGVIMQNNFRFIHSFGTGNFFAGSAAGNFTMTGTGQNTGVGVNVLQQNTSGANNTAVGLNALATNTTGSGNIAIGASALGANSSGSNNIVLGLTAGVNITTGSNNIDLGNPGVAGESSIIRIGNTQTDTYLAGIVHGNGSGLTGVPAASVTGTITGSQIASGVSLSGTTSGTFSGPLTGNVSGSASSFTGALAGDVTGTQSVTVVAKVGGVTAANVAAGANLANAATNANTASTIVKRDASGNFSAGTIFATGTINLPTTSGSSVGVIKQNLVPLIHTFGSGNFFAGANTGNFTLSGGSNTALGASALSSATSGGGNTATGFGSLVSNTTGASNTAIGNLALQSNTSGQSNTAIGDSALYSSITNSFSTAIGGKALYTNTTGFANTATGFIALFANTTGSDNTSNGYEALSSNTLGNDNTAIGYTALLSNTTGTSNTGIGSGALNANTTGIDNTAIGVSAMFANTTGDFNTGSGADALSSNTTGDENTAMGDSALFFNTTGGANTAIGSASMRDNTTGNFNTAVGENTLLLNTTGANNIALGRDAGLSLTTGSNNIDIGSQGVAGESNIIRIGDGSTQTDTYLTGNVRTASNVYVDGFIFNKWNNVYLNLANGVPGANVTWQSSDARLKKDVATIQDALVTLSRLRGVRFHWNEIGQEHLTRDIEKQWRSASGTDEDNQNLWAEKRQEAKERLSSEQTGFIAQELETVFPSWVRIDEKGYRQINIEQLSGVIVQGVNELTARTEALEKENAALRQQVVERQAAEEKLAARLAKLEQFLTAKPKAKSIAATHFKGN